MLNHVNFRGRRAVKKSCDGFRAPFVLCLSWFPKENRSLFGGIGPNPILKNTPSDCVLKSSAAMTKAFSTRAIRKSYSRVHVYVSLCACMCACMHGWVGWVKPKPIPATVATSFPCRPAFRGSCGGWDCRNAWPTAPERRSLARERKQRPRVCVCVGIKQQVRRRNLHTNPQG